MKQTFRKLFLLCAVAFTATLSPVYQSVSLAEQEGRPASILYDELAVKAVNALVDGDEEAFKTLLTKGVINRTEASYGKGSMSRIIRERFIPFFSDYSKLDPNVNTTRTKDGDGNEGIAFFRMFTTAEGDQKPFVVYVVEEGARVRIANVLINKRFKDINKEEKKETKVE